MTASLAVAVPVAIYVVAVAVLHHRGRSWRDVASLGATAVVVLALALTSGAVGIPVVVLAIGALVSGVVAWQVLATPRAPLARSETA